MSSAAPQKKTVAYKSSSQWLLLAAFFVFLSFLGGGVAALAVLPPQVIARGVSVGPFDLSGWTAEQAVSFLKQQTERLENRGLDFANGHKVVTLPASVISLTDSELSYPIFQYQPESSVQQALRIGRGGGWRENWRARLRARLLGQKSPLVYDLNKEKAVQFLQAHFAPFESQAQEAKPLITFRKDKSPAVAIQPEELGKTFDYPALLEILAEHLARFDSSAIQMVLQIDYPQTTGRDIEQLKPRILEKLAKGDLTLRFEEQDFTVPLGRWAAWLKVGKAAGQPALDIDENLMAADLKALIPGLEREKQEARFEMKDGRVSEFLPGAAGRRLDAAATREAVKQALFRPIGSLVGESQRLQASIAFVREEPAAQVGGLNELGVKEIIGVGRSNFRGSPVNRIHNIGVGAKSLNGLLIPPGEPFSLLKALGEVDAKHGYRPELVIKENKTIPEFGGGLCQIGTTTFRVALASGLPILERQNHSYRVTYYEPPVGKDATIYNPRPDFKFLNDTGRYILIQTRIEGAELIFEFWGTKDGRQVVQSEPVVFNRVGPPAAKLIETLDLPVGKKKCTERAHAGADAVFTYAVTYPDGAVKNQEFRSHYRPWGEVCLIGVEKLSEPLVNEIKATSTAP